MLKVFEVTPIEFHGGSDETDHLIKWIAATHIDKVIAWATANCTPGFEVFPLEMTTDVVLS